MNTEKDAADPKGEVLHTEELSAEWTIKVAMTEIGRRVKVAREGANLSQAQLAQAISVHVNTIGKVERGLAVADAQQLLDIGRVTKVAPEWLLVGGEGKTRMERSAVDSYSDLELIPAYNVKASAGNGYSVGDEEVIGNLAFKRDWLTKQGLTAASLVVVSARGDSMEPTVRDADILLVDRNVTRLAGDGIYLIERDNELYCKRLQKMFDGGVTIMSDNKRYETQQLSAEAASGLNVIGRVIWIGGER